MYFGDDSVAYAGKEWREFIIYGRKTGRTVKRDYRTAGTGHKGSVYFGKIYGVSENHVAVPQL